MSIMDNVQPVVKKETGRVSAITGIGLLIMWIVFGVLHAFMPQKVPLIIQYFLEVRLEDVWQSLISF